MCLINDVSTLKIAKRPLRLRSLFKLSHTLNTTYIMVRQGTKV